MRKSIAAIVVTFNREILLIECLEAIRSQSHKLDSIIIIDNASSEKTPELLFQKKYIPGPPDLNIKQNQSMTKTVPCIGHPDQTITINYIRKFENGGGAGGFFEGIKSAFEDGFDWFWLMDDDGVADTEQLSELLHYSEKYNLDISGPLVINKFNPKELAFESLQTINVADVNYNEVALGIVDAFNGTLISSKVVNKIGNIKKEMFIWGDEVEFINRARTQNFQMGTIVSAHHYHPPSKNFYISLSPFKKYKVILKPEEKMHIFFRNQGYLNKKYKDRTFSIKFLIRYAYYYLITKRLKLLTFIDLLKYYFDGFNNKYKLPTLKD